MSVFPFYLIAESSARQTPIQGGVREKDGTLTTYIYQRDNGEISCPYTIRQYSKEMDKKTRKLITEVKYKNEVISTHETSY